MKKLTVLLFLFFAIHSYGQTPDTIINAGCYQSYFNKELKVPVFVAYKLYKGGGDCSRAKMRFKNDTHLKMADIKDYAKTGYDIGHLANAEDFADSCLNEEKTFRFYNSLPQSKNLNRGLWKHWETEIRQDSQNDSLLIICGGVFSSEKTIGRDSIAVPRYCFKVVQSLTTNKILYCLMFTNKKRDNNCVIVTMQDIFDKLEYDFSQLLKK